jgi:hypothetical protein
MLSALVEIHLLTVVRTGYRRELGLLRYIST